MHLIAGYPFAIPDGWGEVERASLEDGAEVLRVTITPLVTFSVLIIPGGGSPAVDAYFKTALERYANGQWRGFELASGALEARGWEMRTDEAMASFYGTIVAVDALCWAWVATHPIGDPDAVEEECLAVIRDAVSGRAPRSAPS